MGRVTAKAAGTALVFVSTVCCSIADTVAVEVARQEVPSGMWFQEDWDYPDAATMFRQASHEEYPYGTGPVTIETDTSVPWGSPYKFVKAPMGKGVIVYTNAAPLSLPGTREFWMDVWVKFDANFRTDWGRGHDAPEHKTFLFFDQDMAGPNRNDFRFGTFGDRTQIYNYKFDQTSPTHSPYTDVQLNLDTQVWDGVWHRFRLHADMGDAGLDNGTYEIWWDNMKIHEDIGRVPMPHGAGDVYTSFIFGANTNEAPTEPVYLYWGPATFYASNPGW